MKIVISGKPKVGKTTIISTAMHALETVNQNVTGCIVSEELSNNIRQGFTIKYLPDHRTSKLASAVEELSSYYVSKYSINLNVIENELIPFIEYMSENEGCDICLLDEIGRMQNASPHFIPAVEKLMASKKVVISTIVFDDEVWARQFKDSSKYFVIQVEKDNREQIPNLIFNMVNNVYYYNQLKPHEQKNSLHLFNNYMKNNSFIELEKLFKKALMYAHLKYYELTIDRDQFLVFGEHDTHTVTKNNDGNYICSCKFHQYYSNPDIQFLAQCSHIQTRIISQNKN